MYIENQAPHLILNEWPMNFSAERKKNTLCFFFRNFRDLGKKKKKHGFWIKMNEWMTNLSAEIKKYGKGKYQKSGQFFFLVNRVENQKLNQTTPYGAVWLSFWFSTRPSANTGTN